jgi:hypothetical protein
MVTREATGVRQEDPLSQVQRCIHNHQNIGPRAAEPRGDRERRMPETATTAPGPQHLRALARANEVRLARAELKRRVLDQEITVADIVLDPPGAALTMTVADLLMSQKRWGHTRCRKFLGGIPMSEAKTVGAMTERQRHAVALALSAMGRTDRSARRLEPALA